MPLFVDVILPIPIEKLFTYTISETEASIIKQGMRVAVPFGKSKIYAALAYNIHHTPPRFYNAKAIHDVLDDVPIVNSIQLEHWFWIADYYMCTVGEVFKAAVPSALLLGSETWIHRNDGFSEVDMLEHREKEIYTLLQQKNMVKVDEIGKMLHQKNVIPLLEKLLRKKMIYLREELTEKYKPKLIKHIRLHHRYTADAALEELVHQLSSMPKQREAILTLFTMAAQKTPVKTKDLQKKAKVSRAIIKTLLTKEIIEEYSLPTDRIQYTETVPKNHDILSPFQQTALQEIKAQFSLHQTVVLHGVTASGKTALYAKLIHESICTHPDRQILYLLPEIAITQQLIERLRYYFGRKIGVYHSKYSDNERVELWDRCIKNKDKSQIIVGTRSTLFLPFSNLGLIIVDESHETSFKQSDPAPRYHARDSALILADLHQAKVLLGSATPGIETYYNTKIGKYGLVVLKERYGDVPLPNIALVDLGEQYRKKRMKGHFSDQLLVAIQNALDAHQQVILFQNRRGYAPVITCNTCGHSPQCINCDITLTYHKYNNLLRCHYCGYAIALQQACLACGSTEIDTKGFGTEQIENEASHLFPKARIGRMDFDTTRGKFGYEKLITAFEQQQINILIGTQMLAKGLDFKQVSLVGVMNADSLLNFPDFRTHERSFQLLLQVAGRAGRHRKQGTVIIQSYMPNHAILQHVIRHDYEGMYKTQLEERLKYHYPPFYKLIKITLQHRDYAKVNESAEWLARSLKNNFGTLVLGPEFPPVSRIKNKYLKNILVKIPRTQSIKKTKQIIKRIHLRFDAIAAYRSVRLIFNVDTY